MQFNYCFGLVEILSSSAVVVYEFVREY
ncbi:hypothetical protein Gogos_008401 [Gossypium gossypioides]|uniref:Uncharacterized protein n=1 Tax=Gossypium gossypioides TaxID=34282 RepID=A0A7J9CBI6_GOSGO|nr:hypothetical protein [Gossypium gossypioides]